MAATEKKVRKIIKKREEKQRKYVKEKAFPHVGAEKMRRNKEKKEIKQGNKAAASSEMRKRRKNKPLNIFK